MPRAPSGFANALAAVALRTRGITEVVVAGDRPDLVAVVRRALAPRVVLAWGERYDSPLWEGRRDGLAYVCEHYACQAPADTPDDAPRPAVTRHLRHDSRQTRNWGAVSAPGRSSAERLAPTRRDAQKPWARR